MGNQPAFSGSASLNPNPFRRLGDSSRKKQLSQSQQEKAEFFYEVLQLWKDGEYSIAQVEELTWGGYVRFKICQFTPPSHAMFETMQEFFEAQIKNNRNSQRGVQTNHGWVSEEMAQLMDGKLSEEFDPATGEVHYELVWPTGYAMGLDGKPDMSHPIYGSGPKKYWEREQEEPVEMATTVHKGYDEWQT